VSLEIEGNEDCAETWSEGSCADEFQITGYSVAQLQHSHCSQKLQQLENKKVALK